MSQSVGVFIHNLDELRRCIRTTFRFHCYGAICQSIIPDRIKGSGGLLVQGCRKGCSREICLDMYVVTIDECTENVCRCQYHSCA